MVVCRRWANEALFSEFIVVSVGYLEIRYGNCEIFIQFLAFKPTKDVDDDDKTDFR